MSDIKPAKAGAPKSVQYGIFAVFMLSFVVGMAHLGLSLAKVVEPNWILDIILLTVVPIVLLIVQKKLTPKRPTRERRTRR